MSNKETLAEHNARLSAIKDKIEELLQENNGSEGNGSAVLTVHFGHESETEDGDRDFYTDTECGAYEVDGGEAVYFENETTLTITGLSIGSVVEIRSEGADGEYTWYGYQDEIGCTAVLGGKTANGAFSDGGETVRITIRESAASITFYCIYY